MCQACPPAVESTIFCWLAWRQDQPALVADMLRAFLAESGEPGGGFIPAAHHSPHGIAP